jgi:chemotaxis protein methyltransferase CheR
VLSIERPALDALATLLLERVGLKIAPDGYHGLKLALSARMPALGIDDASEYVRRLRELAGEHELRSLLPLVTVGKTDFFRDAKQFHALGAKLLPDLRDRCRAEGRKLSIWSAGCATGEEPYSLAMLLVELGLKPSEASIWATDLNPAAVESARMGRYPMRRMGGLSPERIRRFFRVTEDGFEVEAALREYIGFEGHNLAAPIYAKVAPSSFDLILCRNVIIYFDLPTIRGVMDRFLAALRPGSHLLLGYSESLFRVYDKFEMVEVEGAFIYRRPVVQALPRPTREVPAVSPLPVPRRVTGEVPAQASRPKPPEARAESKPATAHATPVERLAGIAQQMEKGEFEQALTAVLALAQEETNDLAALLTLGNLYSLLGRAGEAREAFAQAIAREPLCVEARVFGAMAAIQVKALDEAKAELSRALFLEPTLALGHYLLAQVLERLGEHEPARRAYRNAITQLRFPQRALAGHYPDLPESSDSVQQAARYALAALEENR